MNRKQIKREAREIIKGNIWNMIKPALVLMGIYFVVGLITGVSAGFSAESNSPSTASSFLTSVIEIATIPISFGIIAYQVKLVRKQSYELKDIFSYYSKFWPIFCLSFLIGLFTTLWTLLLVVPGIIAAISYSMSMYLMVDGNEDPMDCIKKSKAMMKGYKWDYFVFQLSFILWYLLCGITFGLAFIYVGPYVQAANILYYDKLKEVNPAK